MLKRKIEAVCAKLENSLLANKSLKCKIVYGPIRSRRLGYILGVNNIKQKACPYNCIYCPVGKTNCCSVCTNYCLSPYELHFSVRRKLQELKNRGKEIGYIVFVGSGEPTLDSGLPKEIKLLREFGYKIAVFTNSSLLWNENIRENLMFADYVSLKIDTVEESTWLKLNRPHRRLKYSLILDGIKKFSRSFNGELTTETTLIKNYNDNPEEIEKLTDYLNEIRVDASFFSIPIYPTAEEFAIAPDDSALQCLSQLIKARIINPVMLCCPEKEEFYPTDDFENELLGLLAVHPVSIDAVKSFLKNDNGTQKLNEMIDKGIIRKITHNNKIFLVENPAVNPANN